MSAAWDRLVPKLHELSDIGSAIGLLGWDQQVKMPPKGAEGRARASATLESIYHTNLTSPELGELLGELGDDDSLDEEQRANVRVLKRDYDKATKIPNELVRALSEAGSLAFQAWIEARPAADYSIFQPHLERIVDLKKQEADALGWEEERYDALLDLFEPDMRATQVSSIFSKLTDGLKPLSEAILDAAAKHNPEFTTRSYEPAKQEAFSKWLIEILHYDTDGGRLDMSPHPFTIAIGKGDVRQTTRAIPNELLGCVYAVIHETGHALYEQGIPERLQDMPAGHPASLGMHESQSRLWENHVGRSRPFTDFLLPHLKERFPEELGMLTPDEFYEGVNHPERTLIRVAADEVTYNLHLVLRFELELALMRDELAVADLPDAWDAGMEKHLGIRPQSVADGVLQDMHWSNGYIGYFPTYTLGTLYAAGFYAKARDELPSLDDDLRAGHTEGLLEWLRRNVHDKAYLKSANEIGESILGGPLTAEPFLEHIATKYGELYDISF